MTPARDRYLRLVMVLALVGAVADAVTDRSWLGPFPSSGVVLAGAAALLASASGRHGVAGPAVRSTLLHLLAPFWIFAAVALAVSGGVRGMPWERAWLWLLPVSTPPLPEEAGPWSTWVPLVPVWLWLLLLSPALLWLARRWPVRLMALPLLVLPPISIGLVSVTGPATDLLVSLCAFGVCWVLGLVYVDGRLGRVPVPVALALGGGAVGAGLWAASVQREQYAAHDLSQIPLAVLLLCAGVVLLVLRAQPAFGALERLPRVHAALRFLADRPLTTLLWAGPAAQAGTLLVGAAGMDRRLEPVACGLVLLLVVAALGWAERPFARARRYEFRGNLVRQPDSGGRV